MTTIEVFQPTQGITVVDGQPVGDRLALIIAAWLDAKGKRSGSTRTPAIYTDVLGKFRRTLVAAGGDLDSDPAAVALAAQAFAGRGDVSASTFNHRLAVLSSFYTFAVKRKFIAANPIDVVERRVVEEYGDVVPLEASSLQAALASIGTTTAIDKRDRALLTYTLTTGRRLSEVAGMTWGDVLVNGEVVTVITRRAKGGKVMRDRLAKKVAAALLTWREAAMLLTGGSLAADVPVWFAPNRHSVHPLSVRAIEYVAERRLGTQHFHRLRHTFAHNLEAAGAKVSDVSARLGHRSLQTTSRYLRQMDNAVNPYADKLADDLMG